MSDLQELLPWIAFGIVAAISVATLYSQFLKSQGDPAGDELYDKVEWIAHLVQAAEQHLKSKPGSVRFEWVFKELRKRFPQTGEDEARVLIESQVYRTNHEKPLVLTTDNHAIDDQGGAYWMGSGRRN